MADAENLIIFGASTFASLAWYCISHDTAYQCKGFAVDEAYCNTPEHEGLPLVAFESLAMHFPPEHHALILPIGYTAINNLRRTRYLEAKAKGYKIASYISSRASIWPDLNMQDNCFIYEQAIIQPFATIGENTIIRSGSHISHHCKIGNHVFIAAGATLGGNVTVNDQAFVGLGAVIRDGITIAEKSFIGAGAVVIKDTEPNSVYIGNPAKKIERTSLEVTT
jgi:sugar O-acyltransferase (sialic acid O-acetyltransferase NeuD family)